MPLPSGPVGGPLVEGVDVSKYQATIDWARVAAAGIGFSIARVSDGLNYPDAYFQRNWSGMRANGIIRGVYQFFRASQDPIRQADYLLNEVGTFGPGDLPPFLDVETLDGVSIAQNVQNMRAWLDYVKAQTGLTPAIYTSRRVWNLLQNPTGFSMNDLWVAHWGVSSPALPSIWKDWTFWQYSASGTVAGIAGNVDLDRFHGTLDDLRAYAGLSVPPGFFRGIAVDSTSMGYWTCAYDGGVFAYGDATFRGTAAGKIYPEPILGILRTPTGFGYWLFSADGNVFPFGDAVQAGNMAGQALSAPVVGMAATDTGQGYWLVARDGSLFSFGDAQDYGRPGARLTSAVVGIAATPSGKGYWIATADGNVFAFGDAPPLGNIAGAALRWPVVGIAGTPSGRGYWIVEADGAVQNFGDAPLLYYAGRKVLRAPIVGIASTLTGLGYWLLSEDGTVFPLGDAVDGGDRPR
jgi:GH25 family lysozyme M1 (1,4-beta-N-acetylmuramidase)